MVTFLLLNGGAAGAALLAALGAGVHRRPARLWLATLTGYLVAIYAATLGAGVAGRLTPTGLAVATAGAVGLAAWLARRSRSRSSGHAACAVPGFTAARLGAAVAAGVAAVLWAWPHVAGATRLWVWDDYTYHMVYPTLWLRQQAIAAPTPEHAYTMQAWYPLGASVVAAWFMAPFRDARGEALAWVSLTGPLYGGLVAAGAAEVLGRLGCRPATWAVPLVLFATSSRVAVMASSFSDADLAQAAVLFGAFAFAIPRPSADADAEIRADAWYAALLTGLVLAVKVNAAPVALVILAMLLWRAATAGGIRAAVGAGLVFALAWTALAGYWYARNVLHTGNPVYPAAGPWWAGTTFPETTLLEYGRHHGVGRAVTDALAVYLNWPPLHATLAILGLLALAAWLPGRRQAPPRPVRAFAVGALAIAATILALLPTMPYSAGNAMTFRSGFVHWDSMRYVALLPLLGWTALGFMLDAPGRARRLAIGTDHPGARRPGRRAPVILVAGALAAGTLLAALHGRKAAATEAAIHREPLFGAAVAALDALPSGTRVAVFGDQWIYPAFGARHDLRPVRLDGDGRVASGPIGDGMAPGELAADPATFRANLRAADVGAVVVVHQPHPGRAPYWPGQHRALEAAGEARLLHRDRAVAVWSLGR